MANYITWNNAIFKYITNGIPLGSRVYLAIDRDAIEEIGDLLEEPVQVDSWVDDFLLAVRQKCIKQGEVQVKRLLPRRLNTEEFPPYIAFLSATVLAATYMSGDEEDEISSTNYFRRLNEVLGFPESGGRPKGMSGGKESEEPLWQHWNKFLSAKGFMPTAKPGPEGARRYINYPISQTLLREADKDNLWAHFTSRNWSFHLDIDTVAARIRRNAEYLNQHLRSLLNVQDADNTSRYEALLEAIYDVYESWQTGGHRTLHRKGSWRTNRNLSARLYRVIDPFSDHCAYHLFPQQVRRLNIQQAVVHYQGQSFPLYQERPGWYQPLWKLTVIELNDGLIAEIQTADKPKQLILPGRKFWVLTDDPEFPDSGTYAAWGGRPELGQSFILLCRTELEDDLEKLRNEGLLKWHTGPVKLPNYGDWVEYRGLMVISQAWSGIHLRNDDLYESLRPNTSLNISLNGGLKIPNTGGWLVGYGPQVTVYSFHNHVHLDIYKYTNPDVPVRSRDIPANQVVKPDWWSEPGDYLLEASSGDVFTERLVKIMDWDSVVTLAPPQKLPLEIGNGTVMGAIVTQNE